VHYAIAIFLSAYLLFLVQPLISKRILPWFGGAPAVWTACMLFFQVALLLGYVYAHVLSRRLGRRAQGLVHLLLLAGALCFLPVYPGSGWRPASPEHPTWRIILLLGATVGLPYFVLSATSPLLQRWFSLDRPGGRPYRLYALSNAGSLLALVSFPVLLEPLLPARAQAVAWAGAFGLFAVVCGRCALRWRGRTLAAEEAPPGDGADAPPSRGRRLFWLLLPAGGSVMLLAVTNQICLDVAVIPFLWILPLALYLLSFIICFDRERWYFRPVFWPLMLASLGGMCWVLYAGVDVSLLVQIAVYAVGLFACCMVLHGELVRLKPGPRDLTAFYLRVAAGGALGGVFVTLVAPVIFRTYLELHVGMWGGCAAAMAAFCYERRIHALRAGLRLACLAGMVAALGGLGVALAANAVHAVRGYASVSRNFYGVLRVAEYNAHDPEKHYVNLSHGRISHGWQFTDPQKRRLPTSYYGRQSGVGLLLENIPRRSGLRVGVVGLGTGTLAAYGRRGDVYRFYEINPEVERLARRRFTYLADSAARCEVVLGDARLSLEREPPQGFDVLVLDAFTGDAIPVHLLTREAFEVYLRHLRPGGALAVHISNRNLDLRPVVRGLAEHFGLASARVDSAGDDEGITSTAEWVVLSADAALLAKRPIQGASEAPDDSIRPILWTDDFSNLFSILK